MAFVWCGHGARLESERHEGDPQCDEERAQIGVRSFLWTDAQNDARDDLALLRFAVRIAERPT